MPPGPDDLRVRVSKEKVKDAPNHRTPGGGALTRRREHPLPLLRTQLHTPGHRERTPARPPLIAQPASAIEVGALTEPAE
jgi:hypothetical protein